MQWQDESIWQTLALEATDDERSIKRAYAKQLKKTRPEDDPQAFQTLRESYERALAIAAWLRQQAADAETDEQGAEQTPSEASEVETPASAPVESANELASELSSAAANAPSSEFAAELSAPPHEIAAQLWQEFVGQSDVLHASSLARLFANPALTNLNVRDAFEFYCAQYCADEQADVEMRKTIVEFFKWHQDASHLLKMHPSIPQMALERYFADTGYAYLHQLRCNGNKILALLMAESLPRYSFLQLLNRRFVMNMRATLCDLNWKYPEVVRYKLNPEVLESWQQKMLAKRYFAQTFFSSMLFGTVLFLLLNLNFDSFNLYSLEASDFRNFGVAQLISIGGFAWFSLRPPEWLVRLLERWRDDIFYNSRHAQYYQQLAQAIWLAPLFLLPLLLFFKPAPTWVINLFTLGSLLSCGLALYAAKSSFHFPHYVVTLLLGFGGMYLLAELGQQQFSSPACFALGFAYATVIALGGRNFLHLLGLPDKHLLKLQLGWQVLFLATLALQNSSYASAMSEAQVHTFMVLIWLTLCTPGFLLIPVAPRGEGGLNYVLLAVTFSASEHIQGYLLASGNLPEYIAPLQYLLLMQAIPIALTLIGRLFVRPKSDN